MIQTPDERLSIKLRTGGQSLRLSNVSGITTSGHEYRRRSTGADTIEEEDDENENEDQQNNQQQPAAEVPVPVPVVEETNPSAGVGGEASTTPPRSSSANTNTNGEVDLERADGSGTIAQAGEEESPAESATVLEGASVVLVATSHSDSQQYPPELPPPADDSPAASIALEAYTAEEVQYAKVVRETDVACMALRTKRAMCVIVAFVLVVVAAIVAGVITTRPRGAMVRLSRLAQSTKLQSHKTTSRWQQITGSPTPRPQRSSTVTSVPGTYHP